MNRCSFCEWIPILPWPVWPLAGHARLGQNTVAGSMTILLSWLCWGACQEKVCLDPRFLCNLTPPRFSVELPLRRLFKEHEDIVNTQHVRLLRQKDESMNKQYVEQREDVYWVAGTRVSLD